MFYLKSVRVQNSASQNIYPGGKIEEIVGHRGCCLSLLSCLVWCGRCCTYGTLTYRVLWNGLVITVRSQRNINIIWCGQTVHELNGLWFVVHVHQFGVVTNLVWL